MKRKFPSHIIDLARAVQNNDETAYPALHDALLEIGLPLAAKHYHVDEIPYMRDKTTRIILGEEILCTCLICCQIEEYLNR